MSEKAERVLTNMEQLGAETVRDMISSGRWPANYNFLAREWLRHKDVEESGRKDDVEERERKNPDSESQMLLARESNKLAHSASEAALAANKRAEDAEKRAEGAEKRAEGANVIARNAKNIAWAAAASGEWSAETAKTTKWIAIAALVAALIAIAIPIATLFIRWPPALEALISIIWNK
jgi:hypothetical protein